MNRAGRRSFDKCNVKVVQVKDFVYENGNKGKVVMAENPSEDTRIFSGNSAVLHCPRTEDARVMVESQFTNHPNRIEAFASLRAVASELVCRGCIYADMTPLQATQERANLLAAQAVELEALNARNEALRQLQQSSPPGFTLPGLES